MGTLSSLRSMFRKTPENGEALQADASGLPPDNFDIPQAVMPPHSLAFIAAQAEAVHRGDKTKADAEAAISEHHEERSRAATTKAGEYPAGERSKKQAEKASLGQDIGALDTELASADAGEEVEVEVPKPKLVPDWVELALTTGGAVALTGWSVYTNHAFLEGSAIFSGTAAWVSAVGPIVGAWWLKDPLSSHQSENVRRGLRSAYVVVAGIACVAWVTTFGHEAGQAVSALGDLTAPVATQDNSTRMMTRAVSQLLMELCGGAILFYRSFELFRNEGRGKDTKKEYRLREKYKHLTQERDYKRALLDRTEKHLSAIEKWFDALPHIEREYVTRSVGLLEQNLATLKGV